MLNYRLTTTDDQLQFYQLYLYAFNGADTQQRRAFFNPRYEHALTYGIKEDGQLVSGLYSLPFTVNFHGRRYHMNGIGDVMSAPEYSGRGGASQLLRAALQDMDAAGVELSYLAPFSLTFYRRFGYEQVFNHIEYRIASRDFALARSAATGTIERGPLSKMAPAIKPLYVRSAISQRGGVERPDWWWDYLYLRNRWDAAVYRDASGVAQGYLIYSRESEQLVIKEFVAATNAARQQLLGFVAKHKVTFKELVYDAPDTDLWADYLPNADAVEATIKPYMMARIVNLPAFMRKYPLAAGTQADVTFKLRDDTIAANDGYWRLQVGAGKIELTQVEATPAAAQMSIQRLSQILLGAQSATALRARGQIVATAAQAAQLDAVRVKQTPALVDYF
ncbi:GNAT family N-acetyltransferase [Lacticaseibacillus zhaodongensis]|uniref:GNAT family N-acetyltransferase n=1 Tax=Lacticaseibacillus zhaodongensis TaxID=2668065 RepID=UPI0012D2FF0D|nr:GNAT family N-acetyltransferase [Lacticaseibacillus zhaodongensis]